MPRTFQNLNSPFPIKKGALVRREPKALVPPVRVRVKDQLANFYDNISFRRLILVLRNKLLFQPEKTSLKTCERTRRRRHSYHLPIKKQFTCATFNEFTRALHLIGSGQASRGIYILRSVFNKHSTGHRVLQVNLTINTVFYNNLTTNNFQRINTLKI